MKTILLFCTYLLFQFYAQAQDVRINKKHSDKYQQLESSFQPYLLSKLNGKVWLKDILEPDDNFDVLGSLGEPSKVDEKHSGVGDEYTFFMMAITFLTTIRMNYKKCDLRIWNSISLKVF